VCEVAETVVGYLGLAVVLLTLGAVFSSIADLVYLAVLKKLEPDLMKTGHRNFNDRVLLPFFGSVFGAVLGSVVPMYFGEEVPPLYVRVIGGATLVICFVVPFTLWRNDRRALADRWFHLNDESTTHEEMRAFAGNIREEIATRRQTERSMRWIRLAFLVVTASFAALGAWAYSHPSLSPDSAPLSGLVILVGAAVANAVLFLGGERIVSQAHINRLKTYESAADKRLADMKEAAEKESLRLQLEQSKKPSLLGSLGRFLTELSDARG
jgi:hypothetical protein